MSGAPFLASFPGLSFLARPVCYEYKFISHVTTQTPTLAKNQVGGKTPDLDISHIAHNNNNKR